ncbi:MAG: CoA transferase [Deltaproteobacteria bacterium]|nr:CoA transferase [Deltaproteobacteria bacterium]
MYGLEGVKVLELGNMVSAAQATKLVADLGADVVKVEDPSGDTARLRGPFPGDVVDPEKSGLFLYLNSNKRGVTIDCSRQPDALLRLVRWADILIHNYSPRDMAKNGLVYETFREINPRLVMCSITPFGLTGPHKDYQACELTLAHAGGWAWLSPGALERPELPPLKAFGEQCGFQGGLAAATATLGAYFRALSTGIGEHIDLSVQAFIASFLEQAIVYYGYLGRIASRLGQRYMYPWGMYECQDGLIFIVCPEEDQWERLVELMGTPEWTSWDIFSGRTNRIKNQDALGVYVEEWTRQWKVEDLFHAAQARRLCFAPVLTMAGLARQEQLRIRNFFVEVSHPRAGTLTHLGAPYQLHEPWWQIRRPAPLRGQHNEEIKADPEPVGASPGQVKSGSAGFLTSDAGHRTFPLPLDGVRVADFSWVWAGPYCTMHLAHLGAEVIKIESEAHLDLMRRLPISPRGVKPGFDSSGPFNQWNQGKKSIRLNLRKDEGVALAKEIILKSDVVIDNFATGVMDELGLGYEELKKLKPDVVVASISGYGHTGPLQDYMGYGPAIPPLTGLSALTGYPGDTPRELGVSIGDPNAGITAAVSICAALAARKRTGQGQYIDIALWGSAAVLAAEGWMEYAMNGREPQRHGNRDTWMAPHNCFRCLGEDVWVTIACSTEEEWRALCRVMEQEQLIHDPRFLTARERKTHEDEVEQLITGWTSQRDRWEITHSLQAAGVAAFPSMSSKDLVEDAQLNSRGFFARLSHPIVGTQTHAGIPWVLANSANGVRSPAPLLGQHTDEVLRDILGYGDETIARLKAQQVLY